MKCYIVILEDQGCYGASRPLNIHETRKFVKEAERAGYDHIGVIDLEHYFSDECGSLPFEDLYEVRKKGV